MKKYLWASMLVALAAAGCHQSTSEPTAQEPLTTALIPITTSSELARTYYSQGLILADRGHRAEARAHFERALAADPRFALATMHLAFAEDQADAFFSRFRQAKRLIGMVSPGERLWMLGEEAGAIHGNTSLQRRYFSELAEIHPDDPRAHSLLGRNLLDQQDYTGAATSFEAALAIDARFVPALRQLGRVYRETARFEDAERILRQYRDLQPEDAQSHADYGALMLDMGRYVESIKAFETALAQNARHRQAQIGIAASLNYLDQHDKARDRLAQFAADAPTLGHRRALLYAMALSWIDGGDIPRGLETLAQRLALAEQEDDVPAMAGDHRTIGLVQLEMNRVEEARTSFERARTLVEQSNLLETFKTKVRRGSDYLAARVAIAQGNMDRARLMTDTYHAAVDDIGSAAGRRRAHELNGLIAMKTKDFTTAVKELEQADLHDSRNLYRLAVASEAAGDDAAGRRWRQRALDTNPMDQLGHALVRRKLGERMANM